jgi:hypothetical protein
LTWSLYFRSAGISLCKFESCYFFQIFLGLFGDNPAIL